MNRIPSGHGRTKFYDGDILFGFKANHQPADITRMINEKYKLRTDQERISNKQVSDRIRYLKRKGEAGPNPKRSEEENLATMAEQPKRQGRRRKLTPKAAELAEKDAKRLRSAEDALRCELN